MASSYLLPHAQPAPSYAHPTEASQPRQHHWSPYTENGGVILGIAGKDYVILAGDTRSSEGYNINTRTARKIFSVGSGLILGVVGMSADGEELARKVTRKIDVCSSATHPADHIDRATKWKDIGDTNTLMERCDYKRNHDKHITVSAAAVMLSRILYQKRFFPYYCQPLLGGLDENGVGAVYTYDYVGSFEREQSRAFGSAASLITPFLDNQINLKNQFVPGSNGEQPRQAGDLPRELVTKIVKDAFTSAVERQIEVGDGLQLVTITRAPPRAEEETDDDDWTGAAINVELSPLKKD
ncbi:hypothetical protein Dda_3207 [Drechslerella dactyloides]|uniref:Proteasome subunit beta n=1 Tax=Drechslerella dactyloides TaxID=74499 RepID=A0AAD6J2H1_DREDA|nr:hypothetical protein Dda_3207 [Drechslerella dactyloides]